MGRGPSSSLHTHKGDRGATRIFNPLSYLYNPFGRCREASSPVEPKGAWGNRFGMVTARSIRGKDVREEKRRDAP